MTYNQLLNEAMSLYGQERFEEAYELMLSNKDDVRGNDAQIYNFMYAIACRAGRVEDGLSLLGEAVLGKGYWYSREYLDSDSDLDPMRDAEAFNQILSICAIREAEARKSAGARASLELPDESEGKSPALIALHGNQENMDKAKSDWEAALGEGFALSSVQSSQIDFWEAYVWDDIAKGAEELTLHLEGLLRDDRIDGGSIAAGSFSAGAGPVLEVMLRGDFSLEAAIFVCPYLPNLEECKPLMHVLAESGTRIFILAGAIDEDCLEDAEHFHAALDEAGVPHSFELIEGLSHDFPDDFGERLGRRLINSWKN